ncbi:D-alanine--D-alanine ligase [Puniceicoccales bacterium CK1056]|uniref:D-alanine--D-alanine ligase n=1 Tax=Oceanipulchritudo coccoides TaxID=2706888 RepID=A0A6B2M2P8_9BACT|nr:D-alanine--D-alanine ligase [Oceanipulchritudo coccoides]NDV63291.1 D-alanine--D-alanine ligase [Oceanipulchritudo coccoides]
MDRKASIETAGLRIAVLCGGTGTEREVSLVSGQSVEAAITGLGLSCDLFDLSANTLPDSLDPTRHLVLPLVHGAFGEDGCLSAMLEDAGFAYAGCDMASSALCFDKFACKAVAARIGIPVAEDFLLLPGEPVPFENLAARLGQKMIIKPRLDGSSVGLHLVHDKSGFESLADELSSRDYLAESFLEGHDLTIGILNGKPLGVVAVFPDGGLYDYEHKYTSGLSRYEVPAEIEDAQRVRLEDWSARLFHACGCRDLARVDFRLGGNGELLFLEINTLPGMTPTSLLPKSASCLGFTFESLVLEWIGFALDRKQGRRSD